MKIAVYQFGAVPNSAFESGPLKGFDRDALDGSDYETGRARKLYDALDVGVADEEYTLGALPDGRWALVGLSISGYEFAIEAREYEAVRYAADGHAGEESAEQVVCTGSLDDCRAEIAELIDLNLEQARWSGDFGLEDSDEVVVEAYHESMEEGCGGYLIREV